MITAMDKENPYDLRAELRREKQKKAEDDRKRAEFELALGAVMASADGQKVLREMNVVSPEKLGAIMREEIKEHKK